MNVACFSFIALIEHTFLSRVPRTDVSLPSQVATGAPVSGSYQALRVAKKSYKPKPKILVVT